MRKQLWLAKPGIREKELQEAKQRYQETAALREAAQLKRSKTQQAALAAQQQAQLEYERLLQSTSEQSARDRLYRQHWLAKPGKREIQLGAQKRWREQTRERRQEQNRQRRLEEQRFVELQEKRKRRAELHALPEAQKQTLLRATKEAHHSALSQLSGGAPLPWERWGKEAVDTVSPRQATERQ